MKIITSGITFLDIDAYGGIVAYTELLNRQGDEAIAYSSAKMNESITETIQSWGIKIVQGITPGEEDTFIVVDVSEPEFLDKAVALDRVDEVIDHHVGYERFWKEKIGDKANIEFIGAACTQVFEAWQRAGLADDISEISARLLATGILDNTSNFKAEVTTERDINAYEKLLKMAALPDNWAEIYFKECEDNILTDVSSSLLNDTKTVHTNSLPISKLAFGQIVIWSADSVVTDHRNAVEKVMSQQASDWFVNIVSIREGQNYLLASNGVAQKWAEMLVDVQFEEGIAKTNRLWLRKEIIKKDFEAAS